MREKKRTNSKLSSKTSWLWSGCFYWGNVHDWMIGILLSLVDFEKILDFFYLKTFMLLFWWCDFLVVEGIGKKETRQKASTLVVQFKMEYCSSRKMEKSVCIIYKCFLKRGLFSFLWSYFPWFHIRLEPTPKTNGQILFIFV